MLSEWNAKPQRRRRALAPAGQMGGKSVAKGEAIGIARQYAHERDWIWLEPVEVRRCRGWFVGAPFRNVRTNARSMGCNMSLKIDEKTQEVFYSCSFPRQS